METTNWYIHLDANKFYASCIRIFMPWLNGKPVVVLSNNDGCSICQTKEAQALGIKMGTKLFEYPWPGVIRENDVAVFSTNFPLFADLSLKFKDILRRNFSRLEDYSVDEEFCSEQDIPVSVLVEIAHHAVAQIRQGLHLPVSCGIARTKTLAKVATRFAKTYPGYGGVCAIATDEQRVKALRLTGIGDVWGIGPKHAKRLSALGIETAYDFAHGALSPEWVRKYMTVVGLRTFMELRGQECIELEQVAPAKKNIMVSRSFGRNVNDLDSLVSAVTHYVNMNAAKLRRQHSKAGRISVFLSTNPFREDMEQDFSCLDVPLPVASSSNLEIGDYARLAVEAMYKPHLWYKKAGIMTSDLICEDQVQGNIFDCRDRAKEDRLMKVWDNISGRYGRDALHTARQSPGKYDWWVRQEKLSPCWTTRESDFPRCVDYPSSDCSRTDQVAPLWAESNGYGSLTLFSCERDLKRG